MDATYGPATGTRDGRVIAERMDDILRDEIRAGALANIATATRAWSAHRRDLALPEAGRLLATEFSGLLGTVLDLIAPTSRPQAHPRAQQPVGSVPVLRARRAGAPGESVEIHTAVVNDGSAPIHIGFHWSDLVAEPKGRIAATCLRFRPPWLDVHPGAVADLVIDLQVPQGAEPGLYHSLVRTTDRGGAPALLMFPVDLQENPEVALSM
jgi:hypothetical protein